MDLRFVLLEYLSLRCLGESIDFLVDINVWNFDVITVITTFAFWNFQGVLPRLVIIDNTRFEPRRRKMVFLHCFKSRFLKISSWPINSFTDPPWSACAFEWNDKIVLYLIHWQFLPFKINLSWPPLLAKCKLFQFVLEVFLTIFVVRHHLLIVLLPWVKHLVCNEGHSCLILLLRFYSIESLVSLSLYLSFNLQMVNVQEELRRNITPLNIIEVHQWVPKNRIFHVLYTSAEIALPFQYFLELGVLLDNVSLHSPPQARSRAVQWGHRGPWWWRRLIIGVSVEEYQA